MQTGAELGWTEDGLEVGEKGFINRNKEGVEEEVDVVYVVVVCWYWY